MACEVGVDDGQPGSEQPGANPLTLAAGMDRPSSKPLPGISSVNRVPPVAPATRPAPLGDVDPERADLLVNAEAIGQCRGKGNLSAPPSGLSPRVLRDGALPRMLIWLRTCAGHQSHVLPGSDRVPNVDSWCSTSPWMTSGGGAVSNGASRSRMCCRFGWPRWTYA